MHKLNQGISKSQSFTDLVVADAGSQGERKEPNSHGDTNTDMWNRFSRKDCSGTLLRKNDDSLQGKNKNQRLLQPNTGYCLPEEL
jgi:hypothetical protein